MSETRLGERNILYYYNNTQRETIVVQKYWNTAEKSVCTLRISI